MHPRAQRLEVVSITLKRLHLVSGELEAKVLLLHLLRFLKRFVLEPGFLFRIRQHLAMFDILFRFQLGLLLHILEIAVRIQHFLDEAVKTGRTFTAASICSYDIIIHIRRMKLKR